MVDITFSAAIFIGGPTRPEITSKSVTSLNNQTYSSLQKILVNGSGYSLSIINSLGLNLAGWEIVNFPVDTFVRSEVFSLHRWPGQAALRISTGNFFFTMNDDDFLELDFFERMAILFRKYPHAVTGIGLPASYFHESKQIVHRKSRENDWRTRPECESGLDLIKKHLSGKYPFYNPNPGFQFVSKTDLVRDVADTFFSTGGFPEDSFVQVAMRGDTVFDKDAIMYWGRHKGQEHFDKTYDHYWYGIYRRMFDTYINVNSEIASRFLLNPAELQKYLKNYHRKYLVSITLDCISLQLHLGARFRRTKFYNPYAAKSSGMKFPWILHLSSLLRNPLFVIQNIYLRLRDSINYTRYGTAVSRNFD